MWLRLIQRVQPALPLPAVLLLVIAPLFAAEVKRERVFLRLRVCVQDEEGIPIGARITVFGTKERVRTAEGRSGCWEEENFDFWDNLNYRLVVEHDGYDRHEMRISSKEIKAKRFPPEISSGKPIVLTRKGLPPASTEKAANSSQPSVAASPDPPRESSRADDATAGASLFQSAIETIASLWELEVSVLGILLVLIAWKSGYRLSLQRVGDRKPTIREEIRGALTDALHPLQSDLSELKQLQKQSGSHSERMLSRLNEIHEAQTRVRADLAVEQRGDRGLPHSFGLTMIPDSGSSSNAHIRKPAATFLETARLSYGSLVRGDTCSLEPIYLIADTKTSMVDMFERREVSLQEITNPQGTFVLFTDSNGRGMIFPNPHLGFSRQALKPIFPDLTQGEFENRKEDIQPVPASRVDGNRWIVEPNQ